MLNRIAQALQSRPSGEKTDVLDVRVVTLAGDEVVGGIWGQDGESAVAALWKLAGGACGRSDAASE